MMETKSRTKMNHRENELAIRRRRETSPLLVVGQNCEGDNLLGLR